MNRVVSTTDPLGNTVSYVVDNQGRMLTRTSSAVSGTATFEWDGMDMVCETAADDTVTRYYIPNGVLMSFERSGSTYQVHSDALGHVRAVTNSSATGVFSASYDAWGNVLSVTASVPDGGFMYRYVGALGVRFDADTGLYYMRQRWYSASLQRFLSRGSVRSANLYAYVRNRPVNLTDPLGLCGTDGNRTGFDGSGATTYFPALAGSYYGHKFTGTFSSITYDPFGLAFPGGVSFTDTLYTTIGGDHYNVVGVNGGLYVGPPVNVSVGVFVVTDLSNNPTIISTDTGVQNVMLGLAFTTNANVGVYNYGTSTSFDGSGQVLQVGVGNPSLGFTIGPSYTTNAEGPTNPPLGGNSTMSPVEPPRMSDPADWGPSR